MWPKSLYIHPIPLRNYPECPVCTVHLYTFAVSSFGRILEPMQYASFHPISHFVSSLAMICNSSKSEQEGYHRVPFSILISSLLLRPYSSSGPLQREWPFLPVSSSPQ